MPYLEYSGMQLSKNFLTTMYLFPFAHKLLFQMHIFATESANPQLDLFFQLSRL